ncbi:NAD(P)/FAD-dependent oxidoreductase [Streptomyces sp. NRRL F-5126]|uniref:NAD(P)/FAD-dependent oxidoreductase n=1 Tax=Streptomyces sp. NRRL F-5126 TaxID=1463857 RepID=UPI0004C53053|nr:FAD/NAD(P)-binding oxidoreductase [Streptomyces sp. NRRL F-5126]
MSGRTSGALKRVVVVGNGISGLTAAHTLREAGFDGELTVVGDEVHPAYSRPALSKALLLDGDSPHLLPPPTHGARELLGARATGLDTGRRLITLDDGTALPYDGAVLATGSRARRLSDLPDEVTVRALDDALALRRRLAQRPSVLVVGGGPLGMEMASACLAAGCRVTLVSRGKPLTGRLGPHLAHVLTAAARERGLTVIETGRVRVEGRAGDARIALGDGTVLRAEVLLTAVGDVPNTEWLTRTGLVVDGAVPVGTRCLARPGVAAAGDLAAFPTSRGLRRVPLWSSAIDQAKAAARALVHGDGTPPLSFQPYFWTEQFGHTLKAVGHLPAAGEPVYAAGKPGGGPALMTWRRDDGSTTAVALDHRIPIPRLRRMTRTPA